MEENNYEKSIFEEEQIPVVYAGFWERFGALFLDGLILLPVSLINYYNRQHWNNIAILIIASLIALVYKPLLEYLYGATPGKKALSIAVTGWTYQKPNAREAILRNIFGIVSGLISFYISVKEFAHPHINQAPPTDFSMLSDDMIYSIAFGTFVFLIYMTDIIVLLVDKENRSLHDFIGKTYVVKKYR